MINIKSLARKYPMTAINFSAFGVDIVSRGIGETTIGGLLFLGSLAGTGVYTWLRHESRKELARKVYREEYYAETGYNYDAIPQSVKTEVWRRAGGQCETCGSQASLEYDHTVPRRFGGLNTARNIRLLCRPCHREKTNQEALYWQNQAQL